MKPVAGAIALVVVVMLAACGGEATPTPAPETVVAPVAVSTSTATPDPLAPRLPAQSTDILGNQVTVTDISRIVVMNGDSTEVIFALGLGENVVAVDTSAT